MMSNINWQDITCHHTRQASVSSFSVFRRRSPQL